MKQLNTLHRRQKVRVKSPTITSSFWSSGHAAAAVGAAAAKNCMRACTEAAAGKVLYYHTSSPRVIHGAVPECILTLHANSAHAFAHGELVVICSRLFHSSTQV